MTTPPLAQAMLTLGDQWNLLIIQQAMLGKARRFSQWRDLLGLSDSVLSDRLKELLAAGILRQQEYSDATRRREEYFLTDRGLALWGLLVTLWSWEQQWAQAHEATWMLRHEVCGASMVPEFGCGACGTHPVTAHDTESTDRSAGEIVAGPRGRHHRRAVRAPDAQIPWTYHEETFAIIGDRWSTLLLGSCFLRVRSFAAFRETLGIARSVLSERLRLFVELGVLQVQVGQDRRERDYRLTEKGRAFFPVFAMMVDWAETWLGEDTEARDLLIVHRGCGRQLQPALFCPSCGDRIERTDIRFEPTAA
ncbi:winged helix-turn-helix transcriptional regulator [Microbacterium sp. Root61]|uniref:winged helix-turn-helix transcriptional regulator n=1 Tax=Microbacterium sp. Root61 TaxID=1736570 RepID=UPI000AA0C856|nr:helix-turn-helix domain-containing protein [Microbacterium sp. Root61]